MLPMNMGFWVMVTLIIFGTFIILSIMASLYRKVGPNQALIVYGLGGTKVYSGRGVVIWPMVQSARDLSLELMSFDVAPQQDLYTKQGVAVTVEAVAQIKVKSEVGPREHPHRRRAIPEQEPGGARGAHPSGDGGAPAGHRGTAHGGGHREGPRDRRPEHAQHLRRRPEQDGPGDRELHHQGDPGQERDVARIKREADIAAAEALRDTEVRRAAAMRDAAVAKAQADQERVTAEAASQTRQAEAMRDLEMKRADYEASVKKQKAQADKAYDIEANVQQQRVMAESVRVQRVEREEQIKVQEAEIMRRERELTATMLKQAEAERQRIETLAAAEKARLAIEAEGRAEAARAQGAAEADVIKLKGTAEAQIILAKGQSEAEAMQVKAAAFHEYNQAAVIDKLLTGLPEVVRAMAEPLSKVDKITIVSTGNDGAAGANKVVADVAKMVAQAPALFETLAGVKIGDLFARSPGIRAAVTEGTKVEEPKP
jgi:flotillin